MATQKLSGNDFFAKGNFELLKDGTLFLKRVSINEANDYNVALVSKEVFSFNHNKSVVFTFRADPFTELKRNSTVYIDKDTIAYLNQSNSIMLNNTPIFSVDGFKELKGSSSYIGVLDNKGLHIYGLNDKTLLDPIPGVKAFDVGIDCYGYYDGSIHIEAKDKNNPVLNAPDVKDVYAIALGNKVGAVLKADGSVVVWGDTQYSPDGSFQDIKISNNLLGLLDIDNTLSIIDLTNGDLVSQYSDVAFFELSSNGDVAFVKTDGTNNIVENAYPVELHKFQDKEIVFLRDGSVYKANIDGDFMSYKPLEDNNPAFRFIPLLKNTTAFNVLFGIQRNDLPTETPQYVNSSGEVMPIITQTDNKSAFIEITKNCKGFILDKIFNGKDVFFNVKGEDHGVIPLSNGETLPSQLVDFGKNIYKVAVSFTPFGKALRVFKSVNGEFVEIKAKFLSLEENPFPNGRLAIYIKSASSFELISVEITDELDTTLLPEEIIYRDIDTDMLQTKVAESLNKHTQTLDKVMSAVEAQTQTLSKVVAQIKDKFDDLDKRISKLEG